VSRPDPKRRSQESGGGTRTEGAATARVAEVAAFEQEFPGASWLAARAFRELEVVGAKAESLIASVARKYGVSHAALNALAVVEGAGGPVPAGEISARMHITTATTTSVLDTLERHGLVTREADSSDRRRVLVDVTPAGRSLLDGLLPAVQQAVSESLKHLDDKVLQVLLDCLLKVDDAITDARLGTLDLPAPPPRNTPPHLRRR